MKFVKDLGFDYVMKELRKQTWKFEPIFKKVKKINSRQTEVNI